MGGGARDGMSGEKTKLPGTNDNRENITAVSVLLTTNRIGNHLG